METVDFDLEIAENQIGIDFDNLKTLTKITILFLEKRQAVFLKIYMMLMKVLLLNILQILTV